MSHERPRRAGVVLGGVAAAVVAAVAVVTAAPGAVGLSTVVGVAQVVPFRGVGALALLVLAAVLALLVPVLRRRGADGAGATVAGALAGVLVVAAGVHAVVLGARGLDGRLPAPDADLVVVALNAEVDGVTAEQVAALVGVTGADVVAMPETSGDLAAGVAAAVEARTAERFSVLTEDADERPVAATSLLVADRLGPLERVTAPALDLSAVAVRPATGPATLLVAVHPPPPIPGSFPMGAWAEQGRAAVEACAASPGAVVAGDYNATPDHAQLRGGPLDDGGPCVDAAQAAGAAGLGTWPSSLPPLLAAPIDHVLVDARTWEPLTADVLRVGQTDHRALVVGLARR